MELKCTRCHYVWESRIPHPRVCPKCKSPAWDKENLGMNKEQLENTVIELRAELKRVKQELDTIRIKEEK
jgi:primosomal protein N'